MKEHCDLAVFLLYKNFLKYFHEKINSKMCKWAITTYKLSTLFILSLLSISLNIRAQGNLLINPRRVIFEGDQKIQELTLANTGKDTARYLISMVEIRMKEDGSFEKIEQPDSGQQFASNYIRFFPHSVTLAPNESQVVKVQLIKTSLLKPGEYRSHMYFRAAPIEKPLGEAEPVKDSTNISVHLTLTFGMTIPIIIRVGEPDLKVSLSDASFRMANDSVPSLDVVFNRTGSMSVYGDLKVDYVSNQGKVTEVGTVKGIAVYTPLSNREFKVNLSNKSHVNYHSGKLHVVYSTQPDAKSLKLAEADVVLN